MQKVALKGLRSQSHLGFVDDGVEVSNYRLKVADDQGRSQVEAPGGRDDQLAYMRVADDIDSRIKSGELKTHSRVLAERDLAGFYKVSYGTVRRAMQVLRERDLIESIQGRGTFVKQ